MNAGLHRLWITFEPSEDRRPHVANLGCGVTAYDYDDAIEFSTSSSTSM